MHGMSVGMFMKVIHDDKYMPYIATGPLPELWNEMWNRFHSLEPSLEAQPEPEYLLRPHLDEPSCKKRHLTYRSVSASMNSCVLRGVMQRYYSASYLSQKPCLFWCLSSSGLGVSKSVWWMMEHKLSTKWLALVLFEKLIESFFFFSIKITEMGKTLTHLWYCSMFLNF